MSEYQVDKVGRGWDALGTSASAKVGPKGQIVIPKPMRDRVGIQPGATVFLRQVDDGSIVVDFGWNRAMEAPAHFARFPIRDGEAGKSSLDVLHEMDAEEEASLERKYGPWTQPSPQLTPNRSSRSSARSQAGSGSAKRSKKRSRARGPSD